MCWSAASCEDLKKKKTDTNDELDLDHEKIGRRILTCRSDCPVNISVYI